MTISPPPSKNGARNYPAFTQLLAAALALATPLVSAQSPPALSVQTCAGLTITGQVGSVFAIQSTPVAQPADWACVTFVRLPSTNFLWIDPKPAAQGQRFYRAEAAAPGNMSFIPPGTFNMGSPSWEDGRFANESPRVRVTLTRGFFMSQNLVTQGDYLSLMGTNPSHFTAAIVTNNPVYSTDQPVESVSWSEANAYCDSLTQQELAAGRIPAGSRFRLPTEAEWEYACRADTSTPFSVDGDISDFAWFNNRYKSPRAKGLLRPNPFLLYDIHGSVWEWCQDWYGAYPGGEAIDPQGPDTGKERVARGGAFDAPARSCRSARRGSQDPGVRSPHTGFRFVLAAGGP